MLGLFQMFGSVVQKAVSFLALLPQIMWFVTNTALLRTLSSGDPWAYAGLSCSFQQAVTRLGSNVAVPLYRPAYA